MAINWKRVIGGILTGGLSELVINKYDKAKNSADGPVKAKQNIDDMIRESGLSEAEFFQLHPELQGQYFEAKAYGKDLLSDGVQALADNNIFSKSAEAYEDSKLEENIDKLVANFTGDRDIAENDKNRNFQSDEASQARAWEAEQARIAREWDSIGAQMERAAAAGVNPISIAMQNGGINSSATTSIPSAPGYPSGSAGLMHSGLPDIAGLIFSGIGTLAENRLKQSQSDDIVAMRQYNIAEKQANTAYLQQLGQQVGLSSVAQSIQNRWLNSFNQLQYFQMQRDLGVSEATIREKNSIADLNVAKIDEVRQSMRLNLESFNAKLPLELQLMESELNNKNMSTQDIYEEICLRHLQAIEQENRNRQSSAEAGSAEVAELISRQTYEDAINTFHNNMVKSAADAGISLNDYMYYGASHISTGQLPGAILNYHHHRKNENVRGLTDSNIRGIYP